MSSQEALYRRLGDAHYPVLFDKEFYDLGKTPHFNPWYVPDHNAVSDTLNSTQAPWEGIGTGWFYSVLGGGKDLHPHSDVERVSTDYDNTLCTGQKLVKEDRKGFHENYDIH